LQSALTTRTLAWKRRKRPPAPAARTRENYLSLSESSGASSNRRVSLRVHPSPASHALPAQTYTTSDYCTPLPTLLNPSGNAQKGTLYPVGGLFAGCRQRSLTRGSRKEGQGRSMRKRPAGRSARITSRSKAVRFADLPVTREFVGFSWRVVRFPGKRQRRAAAAGWGS
jgi:hypothetical protein